MLQVIAREPRRERDPLRGRGADLHADRAATRPAAPCSRPRTTARASPRRTCRACSSASTAPTARAPRSGTGLGLAIVKHVVTAAGGTVEARAQRGRRARDPLRRSPPTWYDAARTMRFNFTPQSREFFDLFTQASANAVDIARLLTQLLDRFPDDGVELIAADQGARAQGRPADARGRRPAQPHLRHAVRPRRHLPPRERARRRLRQRRRGRRQPRLVRRREVPAEGAAQADVILRAAMQLDEAVGRLDGFKDSSRQLDALRELEDEGDMLVRDAVAELFRSSRDADRDHPLEGHPRAARRGRRRLRERRGRARGDPRQEPLSVEHVLLVVVIVVALAFDFTNGFHDTANAVATSVSTRALSPRLAVLVASVANLAGAFVTTAVAKTRRQGDHRHGPGDRRRRCSPRCSARSPGTWSPGGSACPSSSSHALIGGLIGAALVQSGVERRRVARHRAQGGRSRAIVAPLDRASPPRSCCCWRSSGSSSG